MDTARSSHDVRGLALAPRFVSPEVSLKHRSTSVPLVAVFCLVAGVGVAKPDCHLLVALFSKYPAPVPSGVRRDLNAWTSGIIGHVNDGRTIPKGEVDGLVEEALAQGKMYLQLPPAVVEKIRPPSSPQQSGYGGRHTNTVHQTYAGEKGDPGAVYIHGAKEAVDPYRFDGYNVRPHTHSSHHFTVITEGTAIFHALIDGKIVSREVTAGTVVIIPDGMPHTFYVRPGTKLLAFAEAFYPASDPGFAAETPFPRDAPRVSYEDFMGERSR